MVFQHFALLPHRTVVENAEYGLKMRDLSPAARREKALKTLESVGLAAVGAPAALATSAAGCSSG